MSLKIKVPSSEHGRKLPWSASYLPGKEKMGRFRMEGNITESLGILGVFFQDLETELTWLVEKYDRDGDFDSWVVRDCDFVEFMLRICIYVFVIIFII